MSESEQQPVQIDRDMSRANWQRGIGAVVFRELTEEAFLTEPVVDHLDYALFRQEARSRDPRWTGIKPLWKTAYIVSHIAVRTAMQDVHKRAASLVDDQNAPLFRVGLDIGRYAYWDSASTVLEEVGDTVAHFPISLARSISTHAPTKGGSKRFTPESLHDVADLLESPDVELIFNQALLAANGFWGTYSTSAGSSILIAPPFCFNGDQVSFSDLALRKMRDSLKVANTTSNASETSSSGCPARHTRVNPQYIPDQSRLAELSLAFGKTPEELLAPHEQNVAQTGLRFVISALRAGNDAAEKYLAKLPQIDIR